MIVTTLVVGLVLGGNFALMVLGQTFQYDCARIANLAFGQLVIGGSFLNYLMIVAIGMEPAGAFAILTPLGFTTSYLLYPLTMGPLAKRPGQPARLGSDATLNALGLMFLLESIYTISTSVAFAGNTVPELSADIFGIETSASQFMGFALTMLMGVALYTAMRTGRWPFALRAQFRPQITTGDYRQERITFATGGALAVIVGVIWSIYPPFPPMNGAFLAMKLLVVVVSGARRNLPCTLAAGLILALSEAGVAALLDPNLALATTCNNFLLG